MDRNRDDIIRMAREAGVADWYLGLEPSTSAAQTRRIDTLARFAGLVLAAATKQEPQEEPELTDEEIDGMAQPFVSKAASRGCLELAIQEVDAVDFARAVIAAHEEKRSSK